MKLYTKSMVMAIAAVTALTVGCKHDHHHHDHEEEEEHAEHHDHDEHDEEHANGIAFPKELSEHTDFATSAVTMQQVGNIINTVAQVQPSQGAETVVCAKTEGIIRLSAATLTAGCEIAAGRTICTIDASTTANNNLLAQQRQAQVEVQRAQAEYDRITNLRKDKLTLESEVTAARAALETAKAQLKALNTGGRNGVQSVAAPTAGYLKQLTVKDGQYVQAGEQIAVITKSKSLQLKAEVPVSEYANLRNIADANIIIKNRAGERTCYSLKQLGGRLLSYGHQASAESPLLPVTFEVRNVLDLVPGSFVEMYIKCPGAEKQMCVPAEAVIEEMGNWFVFVQLKPELFEKRQVKIGATDGQYTAIISGLKPSDHVVSRGVMLIKLQQSTGSVDPHAGHNH